MNIEYFKNEILKNDNVISIKINEQDPTVIDIQLLIPLNYVYMTFNLNDITWKPKEKFEGEWNGWNIGS